MFVRMQPAAVFLKEKHAPAVSLLIGAGSSVIMGARQAAQYCLRAADIAYYIIEYIIVHL